ncbi:protein fantom [Caerostris darwini]|uniref:Protein fantom n=1 Tax=Caerostris darwini TaxID=1538125 RepID=A0AAV4TPR1_9ARAC|nr:protein fantom [Caerostris darwini]
MQIALENKCTEIENLKSRLKVCETEHLETLHELDNVREMLTTQCNINKVGQEEMKSLTEKVEEQQKEHLSQLQEYSHLLDLRAARIQGKEKFSPIKLSKGENIFEIHVDQMKFTTEGLNNLSPNSKIFLTWNFYEFELQSTPVVSALKPHFNFTSQYVIEIDDYFLCYLHENVITLELHESLGVDFKNLASCEINFSDIFSKPKGKIHGKQKLIGTGKRKDVDFGTIEYWTQLKIPMEDSFKFFKERIKALKYIHSNKGMSAAAVNLIKQPNEKDAHVNELHVKILRGINLKSSQKDVQPTTFSVYKFYELPDQDTTIVPASNNPEFSAHHIFSVFIDPAFEKYIMTENLYIYVFDDNDPDISAHIGRASIPLQPLAQNKPIKGIFELQKEGKSGYGALEILIYWQFDYSPSSAFISTSEMKESFSYVPPVTTPPLSPSSDEEMTAIQEPSMSIPITTPPVPKPRRSIPSKIVSPAPVAGNTTFSISGSSSQASSESSAHENPKPSVSSQFERQNTQPLDLNHPSKIISQVEKNQNQEDEWSDIMSDTEKKASYEETTDQEKQDLSYEDSDDSESESDYLYRMKKSIDQVPTIVIVVSHLKLNAEAAILQDSLIKLLYVEYRFLDYPLEELETPFSLPKKGAPEKIVFNFEKVLHLKLKDLEKWNLLSKMLTSDSSESSLIKFTVVSEPSPDEQNLDCEDVGYGTIDLREILEYNQDKIQEDILIYDARETSTVIGSLNVSIKALDALLLLRTFSEF